MKKAAFCYIEAELYDYHQTKQTLEELKLEIIEEGPQPDLIDLDIPRSKNKITNPTLSKSIKLITNKRITRLAETVRAVDKVLIRLPEEKRKLLQLKYWDGRWSDAGVAEQLNVSLATYYRWRKEIVVAVGIELGIADALEAG